MASILYVSGPSGQNGTNGISSIAASTKTFTPITASCAGDGVTDDRVAFQNLINAVASSGGGEIYIPSGTYNLSKSPNGFFNLLVSGNITLTGAGKNVTTLMQASGTAGSVRLLATTGSNITIKNLTLDGNKSNMSVDEHRAGIFANETYGLQISNIVSKNFTGDGIQLYNNVYDVYMQGCLIEQNDRDGISFTAPVDGAYVNNVTIVGNIIRNNAVQQIDSEPGAGGLTTNVHIVGNQIGAGLNDRGIESYIVTVANAKAWTIASNELNGTVEVIFAEDVTISNNVIDNYSSSSTVFCYYSNKNISICNNIIRFKNPSSTNQAGLYVVAVNPNYQTTSLTFCGNVVDCSGSHASSFGALIQGANDILISNNVFRGPASASAAGVGAGIAVRPTMNITNATISNNYISEFGRVGIDVIGGASGSGLQITNLLINGNTFNDSSGTMRTGISLTDSTTTIAPAQISLIGNTFLGGVTTQIKSYPVSASILIGGNRNAGAIYTISGSSPLNVITGSIGDVCYRLDGGSNTTMYVKESGFKTTSGWTAK